MLLGFRVKGWGLGLRVRVGFRVRGVNAFPLGLHDGLCGVLGSTLRSQLQVVCGSSFSEECGMEGRNVRQALDLPWPYFSKKHLKLGAQEFECPGQSLRCKD